MCAPACAFSFLGTGSVEFLSCSSRAGAIVKKSTPANDLISPTCGDRSSNYDENEVTRTYISETGTHDNGFIAVLLVVVENFLDRLDTRVVVAFIGLARILFVPIENLLRYVMSFRLSSKN